MTTTREGDPAWITMRDASRAFLQSITADGSSFDINVAWPDTYDDLLSGEWVETTSYTGLAQRALKSGRVLLSAEAGSGKTHLMARAGMAAAGAGNTLPVWIPLRDIPSMVREPSNEAYIQAIVSLSKPTMQPLLVGKGRPPAVLLLADGLNEIPKAMSQLALDALDELARRYPFISVIVTERLARRAIPLDRWSLATVLPLSPHQIRDAWKATHQETLSPDALRLLRNPFFLDKAKLFKPSDSSGPAKIIASYFSRLAGVTERIVDQLSEISFKAYARDRGMLIPRSLFASSVDSSGVKALIDSDMIRASDEFVWFSHHLFHDYLASRYLVQHRNIWNRDSFDTVTTGAASFDALRLAVDQIGAPELADEFVRKVYDWNYFGAAYSLVPNRVTSEMRMVLLAMLADKRWDSVSATAEQVTDALRLDGTTIARRMLSAPSRHELLQIVKDFSSMNENFLRWKIIFTIPDGELVSANIVAGLRSEDPMEAWTLANVLRRCRLGPDGMTELVATARSKSAVERWRAVHVLGFHPSPVSEATVESLLSDSDSWVRYGAVRALIEIAAKVDDKSARERIIGRFVEFLAAEKLDEKMLSELFRVLDVVPQPQNWPEVIAPLVQQLASTSVNSIEYERWSELMARIASRTEEGQG
ncbi:NACHT domain-containing protein [Streptomyces sp. NPDC048200]|uniref:NACHT domain-containing protein n=1 Tax=Streptomyces sp. NPDC048200 TaxID=3365512 RepID=UPI003712CD5F